VSKVAGTPPYVELHCHSAYSFLDGTSLPQELLDRAGQLGYHALALTDHDSLAGAMEFAIGACDSPVRPIFGAEVTIRAGDRPGDGAKASSGWDVPAGWKAGGGARPERRRGGQRTGRGERGPGGEVGERHVTLLVRDASGWRNLCRLLTRAHSHTRDSNDRRAGQPSVLLEEVVEHSEGLVCLSGCASCGVFDEGSARRLLDAFGPRRFRVELQRRYLRGDRERMKVAVRLAERLGVPLVATGDVHAHTAMRGLLQDVFVSVRCGLSLEASEVQRRGNRSHVLARPSAMAARFDAFPDAVGESVRLAETLSFDLTGDLGYRYPGSDSVAATRQLAEICHAALDARYPVGPRARVEADEQSRWAESVGQRGPAGASGLRLRAEAAGRLEEELRIIDRLGLAGFFLLHHEILELAREVAVEVRGAGGARALLPPGRGRGSSVSSIVCYLTGLSHIDPVANDLAIGRFLHEDIVGLPDIDIDFPRDIRAALIERIPERYGQDRAALVAAFSTYRSRGMVRDLGKGLGLPAAEIELVARGSEGWGGEGTVGEDISSALGQERLENGRWRWLARLAEEAYRLPRHLSQHPGGMVISMRPLVDCCPIVPAAMAGRQMVQWDKDSCSDAGFLKIDLLGLGMLSAVERCVSEIADTRGEQVDLSRIAFDDAETFQAIRRADVVGVFQIESRAQIGSLYRTQPRTLQDLTIQVALVRPGPIVGGAVNPYIKRRQALLRDPGFVVPFLHPSLQEPLRETLGTIIFQDQVIEVARAFAGFTAGEAESLRRAMSRKRSREAMDSHRQQFIDGARRAHPDAGEEVVERVWEMVAGFAGFGFPKSHGAAFGLLAYQSTWLRVHYPLEFLCALLNEQPMGFYPPDSLIHEAQRRGLAILPADVNSSRALCFITAGGDPVGRGADAVRIGLGYIKGVKAEEIERLVRAREGGSAFRDLGDFASRSGVSAATLEMLAWSGACDALAGGGRHAKRTALWQLGVATPVRRERGSEQLALDLALPAAPPLPAPSDWEAMIAAYSSSGVSIEQHPLALLRDQLRQAGAISTAELVGVRHGQQVSVGGLVIARQKPQTANGITFLLLEDEAGSLNVIVPEKLHAQERLVVRTQPLILVEGRFEKHESGGGAVNLLAVRIEGLRYEQGAKAPIKALPEREARASGEGEDALRATGTDGFAPVAPAAMNFGQGRRS
jgi:error-prone DNA polymerase